MTEVVDPLYTIGFFTAGAELEFSYMLSLAIAKVAKEYNVNLINFMGGSINPEFASISSKYQYQCNIAFKYASSANIDGILLASGILSSFLNHKEFTDFYSKYAPIPMVSLGTYIETMPSVHTNNKQPFKEIVNHLIRDHGRKNIGFITGPSSNRDAVDRYAGYIEALAENDLPFNPDFIHVGDFSPPCGIEAIKVFFDHKQLPLDAIVCANDAMALAALSELQKRNIRVPEDVALIGFDNIFSSACSVPSLSTAAQPLEDFAREGFKLLLNVIKGAKVSSKLVPCKIIFRETCGCGVANLMPCKQIPMGESLQDKIDKLTDDFMRHNKSYMLSLSLNRLPDFIHKYYELIYLPFEKHPSAKQLTQLLLTSINDFNASLHSALNLKTFISLLKKDLMQLTTDSINIRHVSDLLEDIEQMLFSTILKYYGEQNKALKNNFSFMRQILLAITPSVYDKKEQLQYIIPELIHSGINSCLIYLYPKEITHNLSDAWDMPEVLSLYMGFVDKVPFEINDTNNVYLTTDVLTHGLANRGKSYVSSIHSIFFGNEQLGIVVLELPPENYYLIETLTVEIGCVLKLASVFTSQKNIENKLETLSQTDELTALLNRRGFFNKALHKYYMSKSQKQNGILFYADMDGLKAINDTYGHSEGDIAIIAMSNILKTTFSEEDIIGRIGGDEFTILCLDKSPGFLEMALAHIRSYCESYNTYSNNPYSLSITLGALPFSYTTDDSLENLLSKADKLLYLNKKEHKKKV